MYYPKTDLHNLVCIIDWNKGQNDGYSKDFSIMYDNLKERKIGRASCRETVHLVGM